MGPPPGAANEPTSVAVPVWSATPAEVPVLAEVPVPPGGTVGADGPPVLPCWPANVTPTMTPATRRTAAATDPPTMRPVFRRGGRCPWPEGGCTPGPCGQACPVPAAPPALPGNEPTGPDGTPDPCQPGESGGSEGCCHPPAVT